MFIVLEGPDGAGKTTQARLLVERLRREGRTALLTRQPGGSSIGGEIRSYLLDRRDIQLAPKAELALFLADRAQFNKEVVKPALANGQVVICDRYHMSTVVYQGILRYLGETEVASLCQWFGGEVVPNLTFYIVPPLEALLERLEGRAIKDKMESEGESFLVHMWTAYRRLATEEIQNSDRSVKLFEERSVEDLHEDIYQHVAKLTE